MKRLPVSVLPTLFVMLSIGLSCSGVPKTGNSTMGRYDVQRSAVDSDPNFRLTLSPEVPSDLNINLRDSLARHAAIDAESNFRGVLESAELNARIRRLFDLFSWETFLAVNWPMEPQTLVHALDAEYMEALNGFYRRDTARDSIRAAFEPLGIQADSLRCYPTVVGNPGMCPAANAAWDVIDFRDGRRANCSGERAPNCRFNPYRVRSEGRAVNIYSKRTPRAALTDAGPLQWMQWKESYEVFREDGGLPAPWGSKRMVGTSYDDPSTDRIERYLEHVDKISVEQINVLDGGLGQAPSDDTLWDQNGNAVYYEILMNEDEFRFITTNTLYSKAGQKEYVVNAFNGTGAPWIDMPRGNYQNYYLTGAIELKLAWKVIDEARGDIAERFYTVASVLPAEDGGGPDTVMVGLVGMHIAHKTNTSTQWVWATFEHVDNLVVDTAAVARYAAQGKTLTPSFYDPSCATCPVNRVPQPDSNGVRRTQVVRDYPIGGDVEQLNAQVQEQLAAQGSVWQYYRLIGTQYASEPYSPFRKVGSPSRHLGNPSPRVLTNPVLETYDQSGSCIGCHIYANTHAFDAPSGGDYPYEKLYLFADFSFLLTKAH